MPDLDALAGQIGAELAAQVKTMLTGMERDVQARIEAAAVRSALIDRDNVLVLTFGDGRTQSLGVVVGRDGQAGEPGPAGEPGERGADGINGDPGPMARLAQPADGERGADGQPGERGEPGEIGLQGPQGRVALARKSTCGPWRPALRRLRA